MSCRASTSRDVSWATRRFIDEAIKHYVQEVGRGKLRKQLQEGALRRAKRDLALAEEWFGLDEEVWQDPRN